MSTSSPMRLGLTGNIATGKTTVAHMLAARGAEVIDADQVAHRVMRAGTPVHDAIVAAFGPEVMDVQGEIDRQRLGSIVFDDAHALARLESLVHPATIRAIDRRVEASDAAIVVIEAIKLIEAGMADTCAHVWVTTCPRAQQVSRLVEGRGLSEAQAGRRVDAQPDPQHKIDRADVVIDTSGSIVWTEEQVQRAWQAIAFGRERQIRV